MEVSGIGEAKYAELEDRITVGERTTTMEEIQPMKILVVDDEKLLVKGVKFNLENEGYEVECAYDGASAVEMARNGRYDLIILDVMMPELDGQEACMQDPGVLQRAHHHAHSQERGRGQADGL